MPLVKPHLCLMFNEKIKSVIKKYLRYDHTKLAIGIVYQGKTYTFSYSQKKEDDRVEDELYDIGSISKVFTSLLILEEVEENKISLEDNIDKYLLLQPGKYWAISDLLKHKCGFHHITPHQFVVKSLLKSGYQRKNIYELIKRNDVIKEINRRHKISKKTYGYSDFATAILAILLEENNKKSFVRLMNDFIVSQFGLKNTQCIKESTHRIDSYIKNRKVLHWKWNSDNPYIAAGGIASTISDMTSFIKQLIDRKDDGYIRLGFQIDNDDIKHNTTFFLNKRKTSYWHVGGVGTFRSSMIISPKREMGVVVLGNQVGRREGNVHYLSKMIYTSLRRHKF